MPPEKEHRDKTMSIVAMSLDIQRAAGLESPSRPVPPSRTAGILNAEQVLSLRAPEGARPDAALTADTMVQHFTKAHTTMATPSAAATHRK